MASHPASINTVLVSDGSCQAVFKVGGLAILLTKFEAFKKHELNAVNQAAVWYNEKLAGTGLILPGISYGFVSSWAQNTVQLPEKINRAKMQDELKKEDIQTMIYYRKPMHKQGTFAGTDSAKADCPVTERLCRAVLSLKFLLAGSEEARYTQK